MKHEVNDLEDRGDRSRVGVLAADRSLDRWPCARCRGVYVCRTYPSYQTIQFTQKRTQDKQEEISATLLHHCGRECPFFKVASLTTFHND